jgi:hypothetical protein
MGNCVGAFTQAWWGREKRRVIQIIGVVVLCVLFFALFPLFLLFLFVLAVIGAAIVMVVRQQAAATQTVTVLIEVTATRGTPEQ